jgi:hypothetical protein
MGYHVVVKDVFAKSIRLQDTSEPAETSPNADEIYAFGFMIVVGAGGDLRPPVLPIKKSPVIEFASANLKKHLGNVQTYDSFHFNPPSDAAKLHPFMILMEEDSGLVAGEVQEAITKFLTSVLPHAKDLGVLAKTAIEFTQVEHAIKFLGALTDFVMTTFNSDDFIGKATCTPIDLATVTAASNPGVTCTDTLSGANAEYEFSYTVVVTKT